jgi:hypothetical protein
MSAIPESRMLLALPEWQVQVLWGVLVFVALAMFTVLLWRVVRSFRARRIVRCPVTLAEAEVTLQLDPDTGAATGVVSCSLLDPPHDVTCSQSCLHPPAEAHPRSRA